MLSTGEVRITIDPNVTVQVNIEYYRSGVGEVGDVVTFDASAEVEQPVFFTGQGQVSGVNIESTYTISGTTATATSSVGSVTTASAYSLTGTAASATSGVGGVTVSITYSVELLCQDTVDKYGSLLTHGSKWSPSISLLVIELPLL